MKIIEVISKIKQMPIGTIIECKKIKAKYELVKDNTGKNKHFRRIKEGKSIPRFTGLIYSDLDFEILEDKIEEIRLGVDDSNMEYVEFKNGGCTSSGYTKSYNKLDIMFFKRIKKLEEILNKQDTSKENK